MLQRVTQHEYQQIHIGVLTAFFRAYDKDTLQLDNNYCLSIVT